MAKLTVAPSAGVLEKAVCSYLVMAKAVTAGLVLLGLPLKAALTSSSRLRARFLAHLCPVESTRKIKLERPWLHGQAHMHPMHRTTQILTFIFVVSNLLN